MKKLISLLFLFVCLKSNAQVPKTLNSAGDITTVPGLLKAGKGLILPLTDTVSAFATNVGAVTFKVSNNTLYVANGFYWQLAYGPDVITTFPAKMSSNGDSLLFRATPKSILFANSDSIITESPYFNFNEALRTLQMPNVPITTAVDSIAIWEGGILKKGVLTGEFTTGLISSGLMSISGNTLDIQPNIIWRRNNTQLIKNTLTTFNVPFATAGNYRKDIIYIDVNNTVQILQGIEDTDVTTSPLTPTDGILISIVDVFGNIITPPTVASTYQRRAVPYVNTTTGILKTDSTQFFYNENLSELNVGATKGIGTTSILALNANRVTLKGEFSGATLNTGSGFSGTGIYDLSKSIKFQNRGNNYLKLSSESNTQHTADFSNLKIKNVPPITTNVDSVAVWEAGVLKKAALVTNDLSKWSINGNTGTDDNTNFIGTTDLKSFSIKTNNTLIAKFGISSNISLGDGAVAAGGYSAAIGSSAAASGEYSVAIGQNAYSVSLNSLAFGENCTALGDNSIAIGKNSQSYNQNAVTIGFQGLSSGAYAVSLGSNLIARSFSENIFGINNVDINPISTTTFNNIDPLFVIGNGSNTSNRSNALTMLKNGKTGFSILSPQYTVDVSGDVNVTGQYLVNGQPLQSGWGLTGNAGTDSLVNFMGTTDLQPLVLKVNDQQIAKFGIQDNVAFGLYSQASGASSIAMGGSTASGEGSIAMGGSTASGEGSIAMGGSTASGQRSIAIGEGSKSVSLGQITIGINNTDIIATNPLFFIPTDPLFVIGNGVADNQTSDALVMLKNGNTTFQGNIKINTTTLYTSGDNSPEGVVDAAIGSVYTDKISGAGYIKTTEVTPGTIDNTGWVKFSTATGARSVETITNINTNITAGNTANVEYHYYVTDNGNITLPTAVGNTNTYLITRKGTTLVTINTTGGETLNDQSGPLILTTQYSQVLITSDGTSWYY